MTLLYNYYHPSDPARAAELDACFLANCNNTAFDRIVVVADTTVQVPGHQSPRIELVRIPARPTFAVLLRLWGERGGTDDVCVLVNSDCFLDTRDVAKLRSLGKNEFVALLRREVRSVVPRRVDWLRTLRMRRKHENDMQDAWALRGPPPTGLSVDFCPGTPGCDNRLAGEFHRAGYRVVNPWRDVRLYHCHNEKGRPYTEADRVPPPYYFPEATPKGYLSAD